MRKRVANTRSRSIVTHAQFEGMAPPPSDEAACGAFPARRATRPRRPSRRASRSSWLRSGVARASHRAVECISDLLALFRCAHRAVLCSVRGAACATGAARLASARVRGGAHRRRCGLCLPVHRCPRCVPLPLLFPLACVLCCARTIGDLLLLGSSLRRRGAAGGLGCLLLGGLGQLRVLLRGHDEQGKLMEGRVRGAVEGSRDGDWSRRRQAKRKSAQKLGAKSMQRRRVGTTPMTRNTTKPRISIQSDCQ